ncbi:MAG: hypothetical protein RL355_515 [Actinomycetota bacterium]|jgi:hypothetical protein
MALSDHEQKLLAQMEAALANEDPKLATTLRAPSIRLRTPKHVFMALGAVIVGVAGLVAGVATQMPPIGILGFVAMVTGLSIVVTGAGAANSGAKVKAGKQGTAKPKSSFMQGLEERWDRRNNDI